MLFGKAFKTKQAEMQQELGAIPEVAGWYAYYQEPAFHELWVNTATYTRRTVFTDRMIADGIMSNNQTIVIDPIAFADQLANPGDPNLLINQSLEILLRYPLSESAKEFIKRSILLSGQYTGSLLDKCMGCLQSQSIKYRNKSHSYKPLKSVL